MGKQELQSDSASIGAQAVKKGEPSIFAQMMDLNYELRDAMGIEPVPGWQRTRSTPEWVKNVCVRYRQTILKSILKLKPKGTLNWRNYGRCIGLIERCKTFLKHDVPRILKEDGLDNLTKEQQARFDAVSGEGEMREYFLKVLKQPLTDKISLEDLLTKFAEHQLELLDKHRQVAQFHVANQDAKNSKLFFKGMSEGYSIFINEDGDFSGDDRRNDVYSGLLAFQYEIENMRRKLPAKSRNDLRLALNESSAFQDRGQAWFNDVCDEIKLTMKGTGAPYKFLKSAKRSI
jgi:hypothetical protein